MFLSIKAQAYKKPKNAPEETEKQYNQIKKEENNSCKLAKNAMMNLKIQLNNGENI
ncbi:hypothetical protein GCM10022397_12760 [Flavivirga jejuensis]